MIKKKHWMHRRMECDSLAEFADVVEKSAYSNKAVLFKDDQGQQYWIWYDWKSFLSQYVLPLKVMQRQHCFRFDIDDKEAVYVKEKSTSPVTRVKLVRPGVVVPTGTFPEELPPAAGLSRERQMYLYRTVRLATPGSYDVVPSK